MKMSLATKFLFYATCAVGVAALFDACGSKSSGSYPYGDASGQTKIQIPVSVAERTTSPAALGLEDPNGLGLAGSAPAGVTPTSYVINLSGCASGLTGNNSTAGQLTVYLKDTGCLGKLTSFVRGATTYLPTGSNAVAFSSWTVGSTAVFQGASASDLAYVQVISQLSSPIATTDYVSYEFTYNNLGTNNNGNVVVSNTQSLYVAGTDAPNFSLAAAGSISLVSFSSGYPQFQFNLTCATGGGMVAGPNDGGLKLLCPTVTSGTVGADLGSPSTVSYKLIADPLNNSSHGTLTLAQAQAAFASGDTTGYSSLVGPGTGFWTNTLTSPVTFTNSVQYFILVIQEKNLVTTGPANSSFQYFAITVPAVTP